MAYKCPWPTVKGHENRTSTSSEQEYIIFVNIIVIIHSNVESCIRVYHKKWTSCINLWLWTYLTVIQHQLYWMFLIKKNNKEREKCIYWVNNQPNWHLCYLVYGQNAVWLVSVTVNKGHTEVLILFTFCNFVPNLALDRMFK